MTESSSQQSGSVKEWNLILSLFRDSLRKNYLHYELFLIY